MPRRPDLPPARAIRRLVAVAVLPLLLGADAQRPGAPGMPEPQAASLLVEYYRTFLRDQDADAFGLRVGARYAEGTLARVLATGPPDARRAAVLALGLVGSMGSNGALATALKDEDPTVRDLAVSALWAVWFRADTPANHDALEAVRDRIAEGRFLDAEAAASAVIARAPHFAEAYNQRAIARYFLGRYADSAADCRETLDRNPHHFGALSGLGQCYLRLDDRPAALRTFQRLLALQPYSMDVRQLIVVIEAGDE
jgi:tetratricopeptide (TPR) repeat protein